MMRTLLAACLICVLVPAATAQSVDDVVALHEAGITAKTILTQMSATGATYELTAADTSKLEAAGVPRQVVDAMRRGRDLVMAMAPDDDTTSKKVGGESDISARIDRCLALAREIRRNCSGYGYGGYGYGGYGYGGFYSGTYSYYPRILYHGGFGRGLFGRSGFGFRRGFSGFGLSGTFSFGSVRGSFRFR